MCAMDPYLFRNAQLVYSPIHQTMHNNSHSATKTKTTFTVHIFSRSNKNSMWKTTFFSQPKNEPIDISQMQKSNQLFSIISLDDAILWNYLTLYTLVERIYKQFLISRGISASLCIFAESTIYANKQSSLRNVVIMH